MNRQRLTGLILFLFFLIPNQSYAQKNLGRETFMINIRPVLNGILSDFYEMVMLFPDFPNELIPVIKELDSLTVDKEILKETCPRLLDYKCKETLDSIRKKILTIHKLSLNVIVKQKMSQHLYLNSLSGLRIMTDFDNELEEIKSYLGNTSFLVSAQIKQKRETYYVLKELDELNTLISLAIVEYIPFVYKADFTHFYFNFVHPIQIQISKSKNYEFFNRNLNSLNFAINLLNMNLTKRNKKTPEGMAPYLSVIHSRWNSLLRYYY